MALARKLSREDGFVSVRRENEEMSAVAGSFQKSGKDEKSSHSRSDENKL
jgi:hypothetical protein